MTSPPRGWSKLQATLLAEVRAFDKRQNLRHITETRITTLLGEKVVENNSPEAYNDVYAEEDIQRKIQAMQNLALLRKVAGKDKTPCQVADGLFIGPIGAARNLKALRKRGITHILNASPVVPCYFRDNPEGAFTYHLVPIYDDASVDLSQHIDDACEFIEIGRQAGGVLVHCYAGQSRSAAFVIAYLIGRQGMSLAEAWSAVRSARPCAQPNAGFLRQLEEYERAVGTPSTSCDAL